MESILRSNMKPEQAEREVLDLFIQQCRALRDPRNRRSRTELVPFAAQWELRFKERLNEICPPELQLNGKSVAA